MGKAAGGSAGGSDALEACFNMSLQEPAHHNPHEGSAWGFGTSCLWQLVSSSKWGLVWAWELAAGARPVMTTTHWSTNLIS